MKKQIMQLLADENQQHADRFATYCAKLKTGKKKDGTLANPWMQRVTPERCAELYRMVREEGLVFDGVHVTFQSTGVSYDYIAYKNKMLIAYPESKIDVGLVYEGDTFTVEKQSGQVGYSHDVANPFGQTDDKIIGGYCVIKNKRGEFITLLSQDDFAKHRKVAKTDYIWRQWYREMCLKTLIKKAVKQHFADIYANIELTDNDNYDLDNPLDLDIKWKQEIEAIGTVDELSEYYFAHKGRGKDFDKYVSIRKKQLETNDQPNEDSQN